MFKSYQFIGHPYGQVIQKNDLPIYPPEDETLRLGSLYSSGKLQLIITNNASLCDLMRTLGDHENHQATRQTPASPAHGRAELIDATTVEIVRQSLYSAANQMKRALMRTAFSAIIFDAHDFAVAIYDSQFRLLAQSPTIPAFMGTLGFCVEAAVKGVGGEKELDPGDILIYNVPYGSGSHAQDLAVVAPVFYGPDGLMGYAVSKAHQLDIGAKNPYCTDTTDVFQEGVLFPGVKLFQGGNRVEDIYRIVLANSRGPDVMTGDIHAQEVCVRVGCEALVQVIKRFGTETFEAAVEQMYDQGEKAIRRFFERIPDGRYVGRGYLDNNGVDTNQIAFDVAVEISGSNVDLDFSDVPEAQRGPVNCPYPSTVSAGRVAILMLAGGGAEPNEGHFRAVNVITRPNSMFHPLSPAPCYLYGWAVTQAIEAIFHAFASKVPGTVPAESAADIASVGVFTRDRATGELLDYGPALPVGHGGSPIGDGNVLFVAALSNSRGPSIELAEAKLPIRYRRWEFVTDSCGVGQYRGAPAWDHHWEILQDSALISVIDRTQVPSRGVWGGASGVPNQFLLRDSSGNASQCGRATDVPVSKGSIFEIRCGAGAGYGPASKREIAAVSADIANGIVSVEFARENFPHAFQ